MVIRLLVLCGDNHQISHICVEEHLMESILLRKVNLTIIVMTLLNYVSSAYTAYRGALRWKHQFVQQGGLQRTERGIFRAERFAVDRGAYAIGFDLWNGKGTDSDVPYEELQHWNTNHDGTHITVPQLNSVLEVEYPHQSQLRFYPCKRENITNTFGEAYVDYHKVSALIRHDPTDQAGGTQVFDFVAAGEDFSLHFFTGCPIMYYSPSDPEPEPLESDFDQPLESETPTN